MRHTGKSLCALLLLLCTAVHAQSPGQTNPSSAPNQAATIMLAEGDAHVLPSGGRPHAAKVGAIVNEGDVLITGKDGEIHLTMQDTGFIALRPNTRLKIAGYKADGAEDDKAIFRLIAGGFRSVTGWIGKFNRRNYRVNTPTATIGIRGTDHEPHYIPEGSAEGEAGTYDKVYAGSTEIENPTGKTAVAPAQAGFVPFSERVKPRLLARVPGFFRPSRYEPEIEKKHAEIQQMIEQRREERRKVVLEKRAALDAAREQTKSTLEENKAAAEAMRKSEQERRERAQQKRGDVQESAKSAREMRKDVIEKREALEKDTASGQVPERKLRKERKALREENKASLEKLRDTKEKKKALQDETKSAVEAREKAKAERREKLDDKIDDVMDKRQDLIDERKDMKKEMKSLREQERKRYLEELKAARKKQSGAGSPEEKKTNP